MKEAISLYNNSIILADEADYPDYLSKGFICPFCHNALFWTREFFRNEAHVNACFKHHKNTGMDCEARAKQYGYQKVVSNFSRESREQRLKIFNDNFWKLFCINKQIPSAGKLKKVAQSRRLDIAKCREQWRNSKLTLALAEEFLQVAISPEFKDKINTYLELWSAQVDVHLNEKERENNVERIVKGVEQLANRQIAKEAIIWLSSKSADIAFENLACLSYLDAINVRILSLDLSPNPPTPNEISYCMIGSIVTTDWTNAIAHFNKYATAGKGFGK